MEGLIDVGDLGHRGLEAEEGADEDEDEDGDEVGVDGSDEDGDELLAEELARGGHAACACERVSRGDVTREGFEGVCGSARVRACVCVGVCG